MPDLRIDPVTIRHSGTTPATTAGTRQSGAPLEDNVYKVRNNGNVRLLFENSGGADATVTFDVTRKLGGVADVVDPTITVPGNGRVWAGPFPRSVYNDGDADLNFGISANLTITAVKG